MTQKGAQLETLNCCFVLETSLAKGKMTAEAEGDARDVKNCRWPC